MHFAAFCFMSFLRLLKTFDEFHIASPVSILQFYGIISREHANLIAIVRIRKIFLLIRMRIRILPISQRLFTSTFFKTPH